jgi:predicted nuclease of predicted toxin-antitoxin system
MPAFFREEGFDTTTIQELFGRTDVTDVEWIKKAGESDMVVAHKDARIRYRPAERKAVIESKLRMLCLTSGNMTTAEQVECFRANLKAIEQWWSEPGPWILAVRKGGVERLPLDS